MILITGSTGFIGKALLSQLTANGYSIRALLKPSHKTPDLPKGVPIDAAVASLTDERSVKAALRGVDTIIHLASAERKGPRGDIIATDSFGTRNFANLAAEMKVKKFLYISHLGADRASYYPILKMKGIAEDHIRKSGVPFTILRSSVVYGPNDRFTTTIAKLLALSPLFFLPKNGENLLQPLHIDDLTMAILWTLQTDAHLNKTIDIGGAEYFPYKQIVETIEETIGIDRSFVPLSLAYFRSLYIFLDSLFPTLFLSSYWVDYLSYNRTCPVDSISRNFGFLPARFSYNLDHLSNHDWKRESWKSLFKKE